MDKNHKTCAEPSCGYYTNNKVHSICDKCNRQFAGKNDNFRTEGEIIRFHIKERKPKSSEESIEKRKQNIERYKGQEKQKFKRKTMQDVVDDMNRCRIRKLNEQRKEIEQLIKENNEEITMSKKNKSNNMVSVGTLNEEANRINHQSEEVISEPQIPEPEIPQPEATSSFFNNLEANGFKGIIKR